MSDKKKKLRPDSLLNKKKPFRRGILAGLGVDPYPRRVRALSDDDVEKNRRSRLAKADPIERGVIRAQDPRLPRRLPSYQPNRLSVREPSKEAVFARGRLAKIRKARESMAEEEKWLKTKTKRKRRYQGEQD